MGKLKARQHSEWKDGFLFLGNHLALDFLNTKPVQDGREVELLPDFSGVLRWFQAAGLFQHPEARALEQRWSGSAQARQSVRELQKLRDRLRSEILAWERSRTVRHSTIAELNRLMAKYPMRTRVETDEGGFMTELYFEPHLPADLIAPLAHSAASLLAGTDPKHVRKCDHCVLHFLDTSKKGTRRWCSMRLCGNRQKVAAYSARQRLKPNNPPL
jgi:predicted RNA-binding Zn ribbon-like protein